MARTKKVFDKDGPFQTRFRELFNETMMTQEQLANALGVRRPTLLGWLDGVTLPDIQSLTAIAHHFNVSADYLLGISDTRKPDVSLRAAVEYTGLSEEAAEWLHIGIDDFECDGVTLSDEEKKANLRMASKLIRDRAFTAMINRLNEGANKAYWDRLMRTLDRRYCEGDLQDENDEFYFPKKEGRDAVEGSLVRYAGVDKEFADEFPPEHIMKMSDDELFDVMFRLMLRYQNEYQIEQFYASKAFSAFYDQVILEYARKADRDLTALDPTYHPESLRLPSTGVF